MNRAQRRHREREQRRSQRRTLARRGTTLAIGGVLIGAPLWVGTPAYAATWVVTNLDDSGAGSLRDAIAQANATPDDDIITFQAGLTGTIVLTSGPLAIGNKTPTNVGGALQIVGPGADLLTISGNDASRIMYAYGSGTDIKAFVVSGLTLTKGSASNGGAIMSINRALTLDEVVLTDNHSTSKGGAVYSDGFDSTLTIRDSVLTGNTAATDGGAVYVEDTDTPAGGGVSIHLDHATITGNTAGQDGGGVYLYDPDGAVTISDSTISGNSASGRAGGIYLYSIDTLAAFTIERSTISGNSATGDGGGVFTSHSKLNLTNSTVANNTSGGVGGGVQLADHPVKPAPQSADIVSSTVSGNTATGAGGGINISAVVTTRLVGSVVANNSSSDISGSAAASHSLIEDPSGSTIDYVTGNITIVDPMLGPLQDNGGPTQTMHPQVGSPLIDNGNPAFTPPPSTEQRGAPRVVNGVIDIGAVEYLGVPDDDAYSTDEDVALVVPADGVMDNDSDAGTSVELVTGVVDGDLVLDDDGGFTYTPDAEFSGSDSFTYRLNGPLGSLGTATVSITVAVVDDVPVATDDGASAVTGQGTVTIDVLGNDDDVDTSSLWIASVGAASLGTVGIDSSGPTDVLLYTPGDAIGTDTFSYTVSDGTSTATADVTVDLTDGTAPTVDMVVPAVGAVFPRNSVVAADFSCADEAGGSGIASCVGTVADGEPLNTAPTGVHELSVTATDVAGNSTTVTRSYRVVKARPDARIVNPSGTLLGDDLYNDDRAQTVSRSVRPGRTAVYEVSMQNDARFSDALRISGGQSTRNFSIRYIGPTGRDITNRVVAGTFTTPTLAPGDMYSIRVEVTVKATTPPDATLSRAVRALSTTNVRRQDQVVFTTIRS